MLTACRRLIWKKNVERLSILCFWSQEGELRKRTTWLYASTRTYKHTHTYIQSYIRQVRNVFSFCGLQLVYIWLSQKNPEATVMLIRFSISIDRDIAERATWTTDPGLSAIFVASSSGSASTSPRQCVFCIIWNSEGLLGRSMHPFLCFECLLAELWWNLVKQGDWRQKNFTPCPAGPLMWKLQRSWLTLSSNLQECKKYTHAYKEHANTIRYIKYNANHAAKYYASPASCNCKTLPCSPTKGQELLLEVKKGPSWRRGWKQPQELHCMTSCQGIWLVGNTPCWTMHSHRFHHSQSANFFANGFC